MVKARSGIALVVGLVALACAAAALAAAPAATATPEEVLRRYLTAMQAQKFDNAYDVVSKAMKMDRKTGQVKSKDVWVKEAQYLYNFSEAKIFDFQIGKTSIEGDKALVPNLLSSQDKFLNQLGVEEYELYTLVKEDGAWKVDSQQEVIEQDEIDKWFPKKKK